MPSGPRFSNESQILWKKNCEKDDRMMRLHHQQNAVLEQYPKKDSLALFMAKYSTPNGGTGQSSAGGHSEADITCPPYTVGPLDMYHKDTKESAMVAKGQLVQKSMRCIPLPKPGSRPYEQANITPDTIRRTSDYNRGAYLATTNESYGFGKSTQDNCEAKQAVNWHGRRKWAEPGETVVQAEKKGKLAEGTQWFGRRKWDDGDKLPL